MERLEQKKIALLHIWEADFWIRGQYIENLCRYEKVSRRGGLLSQMRLGMLKVQVMYPCETIALLLLFFGQTDLISRIGSKSQYLS